MARLARLEKETSEAKIAVAMNAPRHQKLKELSEGIVEMYRVDHGLTGPLMEMVQMMLGLYDGFKYGESRGARTPTAFRCKTERNCGEQHVKHR